MRNVIFAAPFPLETTLRFARAAAGLENVRLLGLCQEAPQGDDALYQSLGGLPAITAVVDQALVEIGNDLRINILFADSDMKYVRARLIEQICAATGGPCTYTGLSMEEAHSGQDISADEFGYFVEDLIAAMNKLKVPAQQQQDLLALLGSMQGQVVGQ